MTIANVGKASGAARPTAEELPEGWVMARLEEICSPPQYGWTTAADKGKTGLKLLRTTDISREHVDWAAVPGCEKEPDDPEKYLLTRGDILISRAGSVGLSYFVTECPNAIFASYLIRFRPRPPIPSEFVYLFLKSPSYWSAIAEESAGIAIPNVNASKLKRLDLPLPPLAEQKRIVAKADELLTRVSATRQRLARVPAILKRFRQAVLAAACSGRLTADWREERPDVEAASVLLERLRSRRGSQLSLWLDDGTDEGLPELPDSWTWAAFGEITRNFDGRRVPLKKNDRAKRQGEYPYYGASGIIDAIDGYLFEGDFLLVSEDGANLLMRSLPIAFRASGKFWVNNHAHVVQTDDGMPLEYLEAYLNGIDLQYYVTGSAQPKLTQANMNRIPVPVPPLEEQHEIVHRLEALFRLADAIERRVAAASARADKLTQSVLAKAFRGELVPTEAELARREGRTYEPAPALLERIRSGRD